jgi:tape measure domain-containing protein
VAYSAGAAYVQVLPSLRGWSQSVQAQLNQMSGLGVQAGRQVSEGMTRGVQQGSGAAVAATAATAASMGQRIRAGVGDATRAVSGDLTAMGASAGRAMTSLGTTVTRGFMAPVLGMRNMLAGFGVTGSVAVGVVAGSAVAAGLRFVAFQEQATTAFTTMLNSATKARDMIAELTAFAARTPFSVPQVTAGAQKLMAFGFAARDILPTLTAIGDVVSGSGGGPERIERVTTAFGQMRSKGRVQGEELLQLTEAGVQALPILANAYGVTALQMDKMITAGLVNSQKAIPLLLKGIEEGTNGAAGQTTRFAGMMAEQSKTLNGIWSNFKDNLNKALGQLVAPALPFIKNGLRLLTDALGTIPAVLTAIGSNPIFQSVTAGLADLFRTVGQGISALFTALREGSSAAESSGLPRFMAAVGVAARNVWDALQPVLSTFLHVAQLAGGGVVLLFKLAADVLGTYLAPALEWVSRLITPLTPLIVGLGAAFATWYTIGIAVQALGFLKTGILGLVGAIKTLRLAWIALQLMFIASPTGFVIAALVGIVAAIIYAWNHFEGFRNVVLKVWESIKTAAAFVWNSVLLPVFNALSAAVTALGQVFSWLWNTILQPVFRALYIAVAIVAAVFLTVLIAPIMIAVKVLGALFSWLWDVALQPLFQAIADAATVLWIVFLKPFFDGFMGAMQFLGDKAIWLWENAIKPTWDGIATAATWLWNMILKPWFAAWAESFRLIGLGFEVVWNTLIKPTWERITSAAQWAWDHVLRPVFDLIKEGVRRVGEAFAGVAQGIGVVWDLIKGYAAKPINFIIGTVWNKGLLPAWNAIVKWIPGIDLTLQPLNEISFAAGGIVPGYAPGRDIVPSLLSPGEAVLVPELVRVLGPSNIIAANRAARAGRGGSGTGPTPAGALSGYDLGGLVSGVFSWGKDILSSAIGGISDAAGFISRFFKDPVGTLASMIPGLSGLAGFARGSFGRLVGELPGGIFSGLVDLIKGALGGGAGGGDVQGLLDFANAQRGKVYLWGATGPNNWDCSGLVGALWALTQGKNPNQRHMTTAQMGAGRFGMAPGPGVFTVYLGPGHTAANIAGLHAEAYGGNGVPLAIGRVGTPLSYYNQILHVFAEGGVVPPPSSKRRRQEQFLLHGWPEPYDTGGWLPPGYTTVHNATGAPEAVLTAGQWDQVRRAAHGDGGGTFTGTLVLDSGQLLGVVRGEITRANDDTGRAIARRTR